MKIPTTILLFSTKDLFESILFKNKSDFLINFSKLYLVVFLSNFIADATILQIFIK